MTPDLSTYLRSLIARAQGPHVVFTKEHATELLDQRDAAVEFGLACIELAATERVAPDAPDGGFRLVNAEENYEVTGERFAELCIPQEDDHG